MKASVDRDLCISCGLCETICFKVFQLDDEDIASVVIDEIPTKEQTDAKRAMSQCPVKAISIK
ncbi:MAG: ferredoxin [Sarcina sp.]